MKVNVEIPTNAVDNATKQTIARLSGANQRLKSKVSRLESKVICMHNICEKAHRIIEAVRSAGDFNYEADEFD